MADLIQLVKIDPNKELAARLRELADETERGIFHRLVLVKISNDQSFGVEIVGSASNLVTAGALHFALNDLIHSASDCEAPGG